MTDTAQLRADAQQTRQKLVEVALDQFGRLGFDAVSTRALTDAAGANLAAIRYHFAGKEGLYLAVAEHIAQRMAAAISPAADMIQQRFAPPATPSADDAKQALKQLIGAMLDLIAGNPETALWMRFILREQAEPSQAFEILYERIMKRMHMLITRLVAAAIGQAPDSEKARLTAFALIGQVIVFRVARAAVLRRMEWTEITAREAEAIRAVLFAQIEALQPGGA